MIKKLASDLSGYDVCIIGAGPAGLTIASELAFSGLRICVLESGSDKKTPASEAFNVVRSMSLPIKASSRVRMVGGASTVWGGLSSTLDPIDLESREWTNGWPITYAEMRSFYKESEKYRFPDPDDYARTTNEGTWGLPNLQEKIFLAIRPPFNFARLKTIFNRERVDLFTDATVTLLERKGSVVTKVFCRNVSGNTYSVNAATFILAAGTIENVRTLLHSKIGDPNIVGVGFMNHPKCYSGRIRLRRHLPGKSLYLPRSIGRYVAYAGIALDPKIQREEGLLNSYVQCEFDSSIVQRYALALWRRIPSRFTGLLNFLRPRTVRLRWYADMEFQMTNRVSLDEGVGPDGVPIAVIDYRIGSRGEQTIRRLFEELRRGVEVTGIGVVVGSADEVLKSIREDASHHLGGTPMGSVRESSVVDPHCKVHEIGNLYVMGGSVFPTAGSANPTYTIVALSIRLARHILSSMEPARVSHMLFTDAARRSESIRSNVVIVGAGKRISEDVIPVFESLADIFSITGVYARHASAVLGSKQVYDVRPTDTIDEAKKVDLLYVAVPTKALLSVLKQLANHQKTAQLIVDTPVPLNQDVLQELCKWSRATVAEDSTFLPWIACIEHVPRAIVCDRSLYRYHGVALIKKLARHDVAFGLRFGNRKWLFAGRTRAKFIEPRDYLHGRLFIDGEQPQIISKGGTCVGFSYRKSHTSLSEAESQLMGRVDEHDSIVSRMPEVKRVGLRRLICNFRAGDTTWSIQDGYSDARIDQIVHRWHIFLKLHA